MDVMEGPYHANGTRQVWVSDRRIPADVRQFAVDQVDRLAAQLNLREAVTVRWFISEEANLFGDGEAHFYTPPMPEGELTVGVVPTGHRSTIGLLVGLTASQIVHAAAHELVHLFQVQRRLPVDEDAAERFAIQRRDEWEASRG